MSSPSQTVPSVGLANSPQPNLPNSASAVLPGIISLLDSLRGWCSSHADQVSECYAVIRPDEVQLIMVARRNPFDFDLSGELTDFSGELIRAGWPILTMLVPPSTPEELTAYVDTTRAVLLFRG